MDPDDRASVVDRAEEVLGVSERRHRWPFLVDERGEALEVDAWWPARGAALAVVEDVERWSFAAMTLGARGIVLLVVPARALPVDDAGGVVRDHHRVAAALVDAGLPVSPEAADAGEWMGPGPAAGHPPGAWHRTIEGPWYSGTDDVFESEGYGPDWDGDDSRFSDDAGPAEDDEPWWPDRRMDVDDDDPWGGEDDRDDGSGPTVEIGWRARPIALAALGAAVTARRVFARDVLGDLEPIELQLLVALVVPDGDGAPREDSNLRGLAARLVLPEATVRTVVDRLVDRDLVRRGDAYETPVFVVTVDGRSALLTWLGRVGATFGAWPPSPRDVDDAG